MSATVSCTIFFINGASAGNDTRIRAWRLLPILMFALLLLSPHPSQAHALVLDSAPVSDSTVAAGDVPVRLHFNSRIDHQRSRLTLIAPDSSVTSVAIAQDSAPDIVAAKLTGLAPGQYRLRWLVLSVPDTQPAPIVHPRKGFA